MFDGPVTGRVHARVTVGSRWLPLVVLMMSSLLTLTVAADAPLEYAVKANYLYKFAPFVEWPDSAFADATSPFDLCILGKDPFGVLLDDAVKGQHIKQHPIVVHRLGLDARQFDCHLLYAGQSYAPRTLEVLESLRGKPILTVTEGNPKAPAILCFVVIDGRVRFNIDTVAAMENGLMISSKLMTLAVVRKDSP